MTNKEKFIEVFGNEPQRQYATKSWWEQEYKRPIFDDTSNVPDGACLCWSCGKIITDGHIFPFKKNPKKGLCFKCY